MALKKCKECGEEISSSAKVCPKCGKKQKNIAGIVIGIIVICIGCGVLFGEDTSSNIDNTNSTISTTSIVNKENYNKILEGMTKEEVKLILGEPESISENSTPGIGEMELNHYQEPFSTIGIDVYYIDGKVYMKNYTEL